MRAFLFLLILAALSVPATAEPEPLRNSAQRKVARDAMTRDAIRPSQDQKPAVKAAAASSNACAAYGPGFVAVEGSATCVKIGGAISVGVGGSVR